MHDCHNIINNDRNYFFTYMLALSDVDAMITRVTGNYETALEIYVDVE
ncbi:MAG: NADP-dependent malic enzyme [Bartonella clarridgeiae]|nr:MAG: NADP-dependent malic enzyme [Bartonella clarridgeiae]